MTRQTVPTDVESTAATSKLEPEPTPRTPGSQPATVGLLGAMMLVLPATATATGPTVAEAAAAPTTNVAERFQHIGTRLRERCTEADCSVLDSSTDDPVAQWGNFSNY